MFDPTGAVELPERSLNLTDDSVPTSARSSGTSFPYSSELAVQSASDKPSEPPSITPGPGRDSEVDFTEVRPLLRQSSHDATGHRNQTVAGGGTVRKVTPITLDTYSTYSTMAPPNSHKAQELMTMRNDTNLASLHRGDQLAPSRTMQPKARNVSQPQMMTLPNPPQKLTGSPTSGVAQRWSSKMPSTQAWLSPVGSFDERLKSVMDLGTSVSSNRSPVVNPVVAHSSGLHSMQHMTKESSSRTGTTKIVSSTADDRSLGRPAGARTGIQTEDAMKGPARLGDSRSTAAAEEALFTAMRSGDNSKVLNQVLTALFHQDSVNLMMSQGSHLSAAQGSKKTMAADVQPFPLTSTSDSIKHGPDAVARLYQGRSLVSTTTAQSLWRPSDQVARNSSTSSGVSTYGGGGYRGMQTHGPTVGSGDGSVDYSQHQSSKTSASLSSHDQQQNLGKTS